MIRVALIITDLEPGGAERALAELARRLDRTRFEPRVYVIGPRPPRNRTVLVEALDAAGIEVKFFGGRRPWHLFSVVRCLTAELRRWRPDVVQSFLFHANAIAAMSARRAGVNHLIWGTRVTELEHRWHLAVLRRLADRARRHVCVSRDVARFMQSRGFAEDRLLVIPNGIDLARVDQYEPVNLTSLGIAAGRRALTFVGRFEPQKGVDLLIHFATDFLERLPDHDLLLVGAGRQEPYLRALVKEVGAASRVHFLGWRNDVPAILKASDMLLLPSRWEGMPNVLLEAMACGIPVVAHRIEGVEELLGDGAAQQSTELDPKGFSDMVVALADDDELRGVLGRANRRRAETVLRLEDVVRSYEQIYSALVDRP